MPAAIRFAGFKPVYTDILPDTYNMDPDKLPQTPKAKVLIVQHTYGICANMSAIVDYCKRHQIILVENCSQAMTSTHDGKLCGTFGEFAFFSGQWNKYFSTGSGGFFFTQNKELAQKTLGIFNKCLRHTSLQDILVSSQLLLHDLFVHPQMTILTTKIATLSGYKGMRAGNSNIVESQHTMPKSYQLRMAPTQLHAGLKELQALKKNMRHRYRIGEFYRTHIEGLSFQTVPKTARRKTTFLHYPMRVSNKNEILSLAVQKNIELGNWFTSSLHRQNMGLTKFGYKKGSCPIAEQASKQVINLPTHTRITRLYASHILDFISTYAKNT